MDTQLISTPLQTSECDLERIHNDETVSSDAAEEPESLEFPAFLAIDIGDSRTSDDDIRTFLKSLTTYMQHAKHLAPHIFDRITTILEQLQRRISLSTDSRIKSLFIFPCLDRVIDHPCFETWPWHVLLSARNSRLSIAVLGILRVELRYISPNSMMNTLLSGFIPSLLSALGEESLLSLSLSDPLHSAIFAFLNEQMNTVRWFSLITIYSSSEELTSQLLHHLLVPLRSLLIRDLKSLEPFSTRMYHAFWKKNPINLIGRQRLAIVQRNDQIYALLVVIRYCAVLRQGQNEFVAFMMGLMQEVWEERRREGLVLDEPVPLFVSTPLRTNMTPPEMVPLLDSASAFLASTDPLSDSHAITVTLFLISFDNITFIQTEQGRDVFSSSFVASLSYCPPFARSVATLILLSLTCSHLDIRKEHKKFWLDCIFSQQENVMSAANCGLFANLVGAAQTLQTGWSDENILEVHSFFTDIVELSVKMIAPCGSTLETDLDIEQSQQTQQIIANNVLVPLRQSLVHCARTNTRIAPHFRFLSCQDINHPSMVRFFSGVWEEVRREAIEIVCGEDEAEAPVFLTMDLFSRLSMEETELGLSSLSSYLSTTPSPPPPVASSIHLFLLTIATVSSLPLSEQRKIRARSPWARIDSQLQVWIRSHRSFAKCFAEFVPTLLLTSRYDDDVQSHLEWILESVMVSSSNSSEIILSLTDAGLFSNMALVLRTKIHSNSRFAISSDNIRCFLDIMKACLSIVPTSFSVPVEDQRRESEHRAHILVEKVLIASQPFLMSLLPYLIVEDDRTCGMALSHTVGITREMCSASSKLALPTLRERMKGRNEEGQEDLIEKILLGRVLSDYFCERVHRKRLACRPVEFLLRLSVQRNTQRHNSYPLIPFPIHSDITFNCVESNKRAVREHTLRIPFPNPHCSSCHCHCVVLEQRIVNKDIFHYLLNDQYPFLELGMSSNEQLFSEMCQVNESSSSVPVKNTVSLAHPKKANDSNELRVRKRNQSIPELKTAITHTDGWWDGPIVKRTRNPYHPGALHTCCATRDCHFTETVTQKWGDELILTPLQSSECDLEGNRSVEPVSSDSVEEPESLESPAFLAIDIGDPRTSDGDICTFLKSLATYMQDTKHIVPHIIDRITTILEQLQRRISSSNLWLVKSLFIFPSLGEEPLLSLHLSDPLRHVLIDFLARLIDPSIWNSPFEVATSSEELVSQLFDHMLVPLRSLLIRHLISPTSITFLQQGQNEFVAFLTGLMQEVWEARRREGLVLDEPVPLFVSTPLRTNMTPPEMVPLLDSASAFLASTHPLSDTDAVSVTFFLTSLDNMLFIKTKEGRDVFSSAILDSLSSCPPFAMSLAKLILHSLACSHFGIWEERRKFWTHFIFSRLTNVIPVASRGFFSVLMDAAQTLQTGWSDDILHSIHWFFADLATSILNGIHPGISTLETNTDIETFQQTQQLVVNKILVPLRQSLIHCARTNVQIVHHFSYLSFQNINHPDTLPFFSGVWEEVRREAIEIVCGEDEAEAPVFLTMDLFSRLSMEETELGLSSLSSYLSTTPSPPPPVASCVHLFLRTITNVSSISFTEWKRTMKHVHWNQIESQHKVWICAHPSFALCFVETITTLLASDDDHQFVVRWIINSVLSPFSITSDLVLSLAEAGLVSNMALVLKEAQRSSNSRFAFSSDNIRCFLDIVNACLSTIPSSFHLSIKDQRRESERRAHLLIEKVLVPSQPFLTSLLAPLSLSRDVNSAISSLKDLFETAEKAEWYCPKLTESLVKCGFHVATMRLNDLAEKTESRSWPLTLLENKKYDFGIVNDQPLTSNTVNSASSKLTMPTLREKMKGRNEEGLEDLIEEVLLGRVLTFYFCEIWPRTYKLIDNTGLNVQWTKFQ
ncbi:hypothetical protein BLNAU_8399 [Blattamonas nauphoetae]|uniref:Uncharacterized protein n=1 Tax=Blattamonas nauphoetae TaxID=2049346 RepID=A0ABQ9XYM6_9EUKA|nr:hypothetical protein BLNAU_8399 [Blattamonas nauphoetae]